MYTALYAAEVAVNISRFKAALPETPGDPEVEAFLLNATNATMSAPGMFGSAFFDMAHDEGIGTVNTHHLRTAARLASQRLVLLEDIVDTRIDEDQVGETLEEKFDFLTRGVAFLTGEVDHVPTSGKDLRYRAAFRLAEILKSEFKPGQLSALSSPMLELIASGAEQFLTDDPERLIVLTHSIGASCIEGCAIFTEILTDQSMPHIRLAARLIGAYGELLDHNLDIDEDLAQGSNTYATARIRTDGDSPASRREIKARYYDEASDAYAAGKEVLNTKQQRRFRALRTLIDTKFKFADAVKRRLSR